MSKKSRLKRKYKKVYLKAKHGFENYDCGHQMLLGLSSEYYNTCKEFNELADSLSKIDDECPKFRFSLT